MFPTFEDPDIAPDTPETTQVHPYMPLILGITINDS